MFASHAFNAASTAVNAAVKLAHARVVFVTTRTSLSEARLVSAPCVLHKPVTTTVVRVTTSAGRAGEFTLEVACLRPSGGDALTQTRWWR